MEASIQVLEIALKLERSFPASWAKKWDKTRFSFLGKVKKPTTAVVGCLDVTKEVVKEAIASKAKLIISRHPLVFLGSSLEEREFYPYKSEIFQLLKEEKISVFSLHTNFEKEGSCTKEIFSEVFGQQESLQLEEVSQLESAWIINFNSTLERVISLFREKLNLEEFRILKKTSPLKSVSKILFLSGSWGAKNFLNFLTKNPEIDLIITSDLKWSDWIALRESGKEILEIPHLVEQYFESTLKRFFEKNFPTINYIHFWETLPYKTQN